MAGTLSKDNIPEGVLRSIGRTPMFRLGRISAPDWAEVWVKWEGANPTGSMKDRMALSMIEGAEKRGQLKAGGEVVEYTGGSTGSSLAMVCAAKGYRSHFVSSDAFAEEKIATMRALGSIVDIVPSRDRKFTPELFQEMIARAKTLSEEPGSFWTDQFNNPDSKAGYHKMAEETIEQLHHLDAFVMSVGTGGCFSGNAEVFKERIVDIRCVAVEPAASRHLSGGPLGGHRIEGIGPGFIPKIMRMDLVDEILPVTDEEAYNTSRELAKTEGVFGGISSGANVFAALKIAKALGRRHRVATIIVDSGLRYLDGDLFGSAERLPQPEAILSASLIVEVAPGHLLKAAFVYVGIKVKNVKKLVDFVKFIGMKEKGSSRIEAPKGDLTFLESSDGKFGIRLNHTTPTAPSRKVCYGRESRPPSLSGKESRRDPGSGEEVGIQDSRRNQDRRVAGLTLKIRMESVGSSLRQTSPCPI